MPYCPIPCDSHDYLEIACLANADLRVSLRSGDTIVVSPITTRCVDEAEWLECRHNGSTMRIRLDNIQWFEPSQNKALFERVTLP